MNGLAEELRIVIDYLPDTPNDVMVDEIGDQISIGLPNLELYLYEATAKALRDALIEELGLPEEPVEEDE